MLSDLAYCNYESYNVKLANLFGLNMAIYINLLMNIDSKAYDKDKLTEGFFILNRDYVTARTTISEKEQLLLDDKLIDLSIIEKQENNIIKFNFDTVATILMSENESLTKDIKSICKKKSSTKRSKDIDRDIRLDELKSKVYTKCDELKLALYEWIETVYDKDGWMSIKAIIQAQKLIDNAVMEPDGRKNLDKALEIVSIATINGYRDMQWAVNKLPNKTSYLKNHKIAPQIDMRKTIAVSPEEF